MSRKNSKNVRTQTFYLIKEDFVHDHQMFKDPNLKSIATKNIPGGTKSVFGVAKAPKQLGHLSEVNTHLLFPGKANILVKLKLQAP